MFAVTFFLGDNIAPIVMLFKGEDTMQSAIAKMESFDQMVLGNGQTKRLALADDFGQELELYRQPIGILKQDMRLAREADIERGVFNAVTQAKAQERAKTDPTLSAHFRTMQQGPAVLNPMGGGMPRFNG